MDKLSLTNTKASLFFILMITCIFPNPTDSGAVKLTQENVDKILASNELVFINFYEEFNWDSKVLMPIFDEAADMITKIVAEEFPNYGQVVLGTVNRDKESAVASRFHITGFPTTPRLKIFRNGQQMKKEYKGQRTVDALINFIKQQLEDPIKEFKESRELETLESNKSIIIGYFDRKNQPEYNILRRVASQLKDDCQFYVSFGEAPKQMHPYNKPSVVFRQDKNQSTDLDELYPGAFTNLDKLLDWVDKKCIPLVRELTFENTKDHDRVPRLILYHAPEDKESIKKYNEILENDLVSEKQYINFFTADGEKFSKVLRRFWESENLPKKDLPAIAIDDFKHLYFFHNFKDIEVPGKLRRFVEDLYSGKLHREYHYGPDPDSDTTTTPTTTSEL